MADTITAFYTFTPNTTAQSSQVNNNFSLIRGTLIPIDENTATGADATYDLGTADYRFRDEYLSRYLYFGTPNTTGGWRMGLGATTTTFSIEYYSSTAYVIKGEFLA